MSNVLGVTAIIALVVFIGYAIVSSGNGKGKGGGGW